MMNIKQYTPSLVKNLARSVRSRLQQVPTKAALGNLSVPNGQSGSTSAPVVCAESAAGQTLIWDQRVTYVGTWPGGCPSPTILLSVYIHRMCLNSSRRGTANFVSRLQTRLASWRYAERCRP
jgi:hypothetical protein